MRSFRFEGIENFRDIGGYETPYGQTSYGVVFRSGNFVEATDKDIDKVLSLGVKSVLDLRNGDDKQKHPSPFIEIPSVRLYPLDVNGNGRIPTDRKDQLASYMEMLEDTEKARAIIDVLMRAEKPLVIHCNAGKDRTGVFIALLLLANGVSIEDINADYFLSFPYLPKMEARARENPFMPSVIYTPSTSLMPSFIDAFQEKYGGINGYLRFLGFDNQERFLFFNLLGKQEFSYGAVTLKDGKALIEKMAGGHYSLPKGHIEPTDIDGLACARREIKEETGLDASTESTRNYQIVYSPGAGVAKRVTFYIADVIGGAIAPQSSEVSEILFLTPKEALSILTYKTDRDVLSWALRIRGLIA